MTSVLACHILTPTQPVGNGRPQRGSNPGPPHLLSLLSYRAPQKKMKKKKKKKKKRKKKKKKKRKKKKKKKKKKNKNNKKNKNKNKK